MKLATNNKTGLMQVTKITAAESKIIVTGNILGAVPVRAVLTAAEAKKGLSMMSFKTILAAIGILVFR